MGGSDLQNFLLHPRVQIVALCDVDANILDQDGFFDKDIDGAKYLTEGWQQKTYDKFQATYPAAVLLFYINHLDWEVSKAEKIFQPHV